MTVFAVHAPLPAQQPDIPSDPVALLRTGSDQTEAIKIHDHIYLALGFGNCFMVTTTEGNVIIDTSLPVNAARQKKLLQAVDAGPIKYIILTHGHGDHRGGVSTWKEAGTEVIAQREYVEFLHYQARLGGFFNERNAAQFGGRIPGAPARNVEGNYPAEIDATVLFDDEYRFTLGGTEFVLYHTPGETYDHLTVWIPAYKAAFVGDNYYGSFPNIYTLRGTEPRWALDYVESLNKVLALKPEILIPSHGMPVHANDEITRVVTRYRDAIAYVHDETVKGMNAGKDVFTLMDEIKLPPALDIGESYGKISWSVRGIYEGYVGWFDGNPATMYESPPAAAYPELVAMAGGAEKIAARAVELVGAGHLLNGLHLADIALTAAPDNKTALQARLTALQALVDASVNSNETGWLRYGITQTQKKLDQ